MRDYDGHDQAALGQRITLADAPPCARPILFETRDPEFRYWGQGSGFFAVNGDDWLLFTAEHVVRDQDVRAIRVLPTDGARRWVAFDRQVTGLPVDPEDSDVADVRCFHLDTTDLRIPNGEQMHAIELEGDPFAVTIGDTLFIAGYPGKTRAIDYDDCRIEAECRTFSGRYLGRSVSARCHEMELIDLEGIDDLNGLSGSPVLWMHKSKGSRVTVRLAGMVLRATAASSRVHFVEVAVLRKFAREATPTSSVVQ